ncbi:aldolase/citrate lyase family protein [Nocardia sp. NPDC101769]|uniref:aldolase/citrate lyase family protein n=1 Tax=Nocardia sp. NPDC101769 TaxID=3364333 RepID=UPI00381097EF
MRCPGTWLYVPGDRPDRMVNAMASGAAVVALDLQDAVAESRKTRARASVAEFLAAADGGAAATPVPGDDRLQFTLSWEPIVKATPHTAAIDPAKADKTAQFVATYRTCPVSTPPRPTTPASRRT